MDGIEADEAQCAYWLERSPALVTALAPKIGYAEAAKLAKEALATGLTVRELVTKKGVLKGKELEEVLDLRAMTELGVPGERDTEEALHLDDLERQRTGIEPLEQVERYVVTGTLFSVLPSGVPWWACPWNTASTGYRVSGSSSRLHPRNG